MRFWAHEGGVLKLRTIGLSDYSVLEGMIRPMLQGELAGLSANASAHELNRRGVRTARGGQWTARAVINVR